LQILAAAQWLCPPDRDPFWAAVAAELTGRELGEGVIARAISKAFKAYFQPPLEADGQYQPRQMRKLTHGERKPEQRYEEIFDDGAPRSGRRQRRAAR
jgi:hypothetical protein